MSTPIDLWTSLYGLINFNINHITYRIAHSMYILMLASISRNNSLRARVKLSSILQFNLLSLTGSYSYLQNLFFLCARVGYTYYFIFLLKDSQYRFKSKHSIKIRTRNLSYKDTRGCFNMN